MVKWSGDRILGETPRETALEYMYFASASIYEYFVCTSSVPMPISYYYLLLSTY